MSPCGWCLKMACPTDPPVGTSGATTGYLFLLQPYRIGWRRGEKKAQEHMSGAFLEWALEAFSGYAAVDELYEGPYCVLSAVDNRHYKRVLYEVLDHDATHTCKGLQSKWAGTAINGKLRPDYLDLSSP